MPSPFVVPESELLAVRRTEKSVGPSASSRLLAESYRWARR